MGNVTRKKLVNVSGKAIGPRARDAGTSLCMQAAAYKYGLRGTVADISSLSKWRRLTSRAWLG